MLCQKPKPKSCLPKKYIAKRKKKVKKKNFSLYVAMAVINGKVFNRQKKRRNLSSVLVVWFSLYSFPDTFLPFSTLLIIFLLTYRFDNNNV